MPVRRELQDLPYAPYLAAHEGPLEPDGRYENVHLHGGPEGALEIAEADANGSRFLEAALSAVTFDGGTFQHSRLTDVWIHGVRWISSDLAKTSWMDVEIIGSVLAGAQLFDCQLRRVVFHECKFDSVNVRSTKLQEVSFVDCQLSHVDFGGATLTKVDFPGSRLLNCRFEGATMKKVDFRGVTELGIDAGHESLGGSTISSLQLMELAPHFAAALGIAVKDD